MELSKMIVSRIGLAFALLILSLVSASAQNTPPVLTNFTWQNQGSCIGAQNPSGTLTMFHPGAPGLLFNWCVLTAPLPVSASYTIITGLQGHILGKAASLGFVLYDSATGKMVVHSLGQSDSGAAGLAAWKMTNFTTYAGPSPGGTYYNFVLPMAAGNPPKYFRMKSNGTVRTFAISHDKEVWFTIAIVAANDFITPTHFGYTLRGTGDSMASIMTVIHESVTTP